MGLLFVLTLPGLVCLLVLLVALERFGLWAHRRSWLPWRRRTEPPGAQALPLSSIGFEEVDALLTGAKRTELAERHSRTMLRDEEGDGAPPRLLVDLDRGEVPIAVTPGYRDAAGVTPRQSPPVTTCRRPRAGRIRRS